MAKGDDALRKKKNEANRKKNRQNETSSVSNRVAAIIAAKKRRKSGKRRNCQGMCFSLPTPEDPFNDRDEKIDLKRKETRKLCKSHVRTDRQEHQLVKAKKLGNEQTISIESNKNVGHENLVKRGKEKKLPTGEEAAYDQRGLAFRRSGCPTKFLIMCLNSIEKALRHDEFGTEEEEPLLVNQWGIEFWKCYTIGRDILETGDACSTIEQVAWIASTAADSITRREEEGQSPTWPFLLFIVPSQEKANKVRSVCKPLKAFGVHTVSIHPGASIDHQIHGLKSCEPEFLVSTPERLLELVSMKALDISGVSLLVVDGLETLLNGDYFEVIKSIRQCILTDPHTVVFSDCSNNTSTHAVQNLLRRRICRLSSNESTTSQAACISQSVHVCVSEEEKLIKAIEVLDQACGDQFNKQFPKVLFLAGKDCKFRKLGTALKSKGFFVSMDLNCNKSEVKNSKSRPAVFIIKVEDVNMSDLGEFEVVINLDFVSSIDKYVQILTSMARHTVKGVLHSFLTAEDAMLAEPLIEILGKCRQAVPEALRSLSQSTSMLEP